MSDWTTNWFACSVCGEPFDVKRTDDDGHHYSYCKRCKVVVRVRVDSEVSTANGQEELSTKLIK